MVCYAVMRFRNTTSISTHTYSLCRNICNFTNLYENFSFSTYSIIYRNSVCEVKPAFKTIPNSLNTIITITTKKIQCQAIQCKLFQDRSYIQIYSAICLSSKPNDFSWLLKNILASKEKLQLFCRKLCLYLCAVQYHKCLMTMKAVVVVNPDGEKR